VLLAVGALVRGVAAKVSATVDPEHLAEARLLLRTDDVSVVLDTALVALIERARAALARGSPGSGPAGRRPCRPLRPSLGRRAIAVHRGDVWWADVPGDKRRPVVVLTRERFISRLTSVTLAPVTTRVRGIPTEVELVPEDGMPRRCAADFDHAFALSRERLHERITRLNDDRLADVCRAYRFAVGC